MLLTSDLSISASPRWNTLQTNITTRYTTDSVDFSLGYGEEVEVGSVQTIPQPKLCHLITTNIAQPTADVEAQGMITTAITSLTISEEVDKGAKDARDTGTTAQE